MKTIFFTHSEKAEERRAGERRAEERRAGERRAEEKEQLSKPGRDFFYKSSKTKSLLQVLDLLILKDNYVFHVS